MAKEYGVPTDNCDVPPSLYAPSVALSDSLLDVTSVSHNVSPFPHTQTKRESLGRGISTYNKYQNTAFVYVNCFMLYICHL